MSMGFSRQEYWSGLPFPPPGDLPKIQGSHCALQNEQMAKVGEKVYSIYKGMIK